MTTEERQARSAQRNADICAYYQQGINASATTSAAAKACASRFGLGRQRILQILQTAGVWKPYVKTGRTKFLGVNISEQTRDALKEKASEAGVSVSRMVSDVVDEMVAK